MQIGGHNVEVITRDTAKVGCTSVTRAEAEALLAEMNKLSEKFLHPERVYSSDFVSFTLRDKEVSWLSANSDPNFVHSCSYGQFRSVSLCLTKEKAEQILKFLAERLGYVAYKLNSNSQPKKFIIEYRDRFHPTNDWSVWRRSNNKSASREFDSFEAAQDQAVTKQREMGTCYQYRAVPLP